MTEVVYGQLACRGREWFVSTDRALDLEPGDFALVRSPTGRECVVLLLHRVRHSQRIGTVLWRFRKCIVRPIGAAEYDHVSQQEIWARELAQVKARAPVKTIGQQRRRARRARKKRAPEV